MIVHGLDGLGSRLLSLETHSSHTLGATIRTNENISTNDGADFSEQVLQVLPRGSVRKVTNKNLAIGTGTLNNGSREPTTTTAVGHHSVSSVAHGGTTTVGNTLHGDHHPSTLHGAHHTSTLHHVSTSSTVHSSPVSATPTSTGVVIGVNAIFTNEDGPLSTLQHGIVKSVDGHLGLGLGVEFNNTASLGVTALGHENISKHNLTGLSHVILEILPAGGVRQVTNVHPLAVGSVLVHTVTLHRNWRLHILHLFHIHPFQTTSPSSPRSSLRNTRRTTKSKGLSK
mmetsp:Transcript_19694/g.30831  ORF Transcript_19694/g.30831 Transcript_19694/m.30831 type:complete len:284 (+) Transcript_19694:159-1010(+)